MKKLLLAALLCAVTGCGAAQADQAAESVEKRLAAIEARTKKQEKLLAEIAAHTQAAAEELEEQQKILEWLWDALFGERQPK